MKKVTRKIANLLCSVGFLSCCVPFSSQAMGSGNAMLDLESELLQSLNNAQKINGAMCFIRFFSDAYNPYLVLSFRNGFCLLPRDVEGIYRLCEYGPYFSYGSDKDCCNLEAVGSFLSKAIDKEKSRELLARFEENTYPRQLLAYFLDTLTREARKRGLEDFDAVCRWGHITMAADSCLDGWRKHVADKFNSFLDELHTRVGGDEDNYSYGVSEIDNVFEEIGEENSIPGAALYGRVLERFALRERRKEYPRGAINESLRGVGGPEGAEYFSGADAIRACGFLTEHREALLDRIAERANR